MFSLFGANLVPLPHKSDLLTKILEKVFSEMKNAMEAFL
jgi:hypothetical protein